MKVNITVDCTPEEARAFLGLPDIAPMQEAAMKHLKENMEKAAKSMDPEGVMKAFFPMKPEQLADMQKAFWSQFAKGSGS
ncbi:MAG: DUF6489 family protein [Rhodospirillaceae bacterium]|nr:DUF6489 family protein [Rhodospirillaceae bacterium]